MSDIHYLAYVLQPYAADPTTLFFCANGSEPLRSINPYELAQLSGRIISYDLSNIVPTLQRHGVNIPQGLIDVTEAARLAYGRVKESDGHLLSIWHLLRRDGDDDESWQALRQLIYSAGGNTSNVDVAALMKRVTASLAAVWRRTAAELEERGEQERFELIERPIGALLLDTQYRGIRINRVRVDQRLGNLALDIARSAAKLRLRWQVTAPSSRASLASALLADGQPDLAHALRTNTFDDAIDLVKRGDTLPNAIREYRAATHDKALLLHISALGSERIYPSFAVMGTVTARSMARSPSVQFIKRSSRDIIEPDDGKLLLYADYAQFEPGILADDSGDRNLRVDYNSGDIYDALSLKTFGDASRREQAKLIFLSYCYGMGARRAAEIIASDTGMASADELESHIRTFFAEYSMLGDWKTRLEHELLTTGRVGSRMGNFRYRPRKGTHLYSSEKRWVLSQRIQGTASLILKRAMLRVASTTSAELLLPMHDAALYQVPIADFEETKRQIGTEFVTAFAQECPSIKPRVTFKPFADV